MTKIFNNERKELAEMLAGALSDASLNLGAPMHMSVLLSLTSVFQMTDPKVLIDEIFNAHNDTARLLDCTIDRKALMGRLINAVPGVAPLLSPQQTRDAMSEGDLVHVREHGADQFKVLRKYDDEVEVADEAKSLLRPYSDIMMLSAGQV